MVTATLHFLEEVQDVPPEALVFGDQMCCNRAMTPTYGRAEEGKRAVDSVPGNKGKNISVMGMLTLTGLLCLAGLEGSFNGELVVDFFQVYLLPKLKPGQVVEI